MFHNLQPHGLQHPRLPYPLPSPEAYSDSCPLSQWCCLTISSFIVPFSCLPSFPASRSSPMTWLFTSGGQSIGASALASDLPMNIQSWFPLELTGLISLQSKGLSRVCSKTTVQKHQFFDVQPSLWSQLSYLYMITGKTRALTIKTFADKVMSLLFNTLSRFVVALLLRIKHLLIPWLQSPSAVILEPKKRKSVTVSIVSHLFALKLWDQMLWSWFSECWVLSQLFHSSFTFIKKLFRFCSLSAIRVVYLSISELIDTFPSSLVSSLCFIQPGSLHDVLCV